MLVIVNKKSNSNQWDYSDNLQLFVDAFQNPGNNQQIVCNYKGTKTIEELGLTEFTGAIPDVGEKIRIITIGALDERLTFDESDLIDNSNNKYVKVLNKRLGRKAYIDLDSPAFSDALDLLIVANCIAPGRKADLMVDGVEIEKYNGPL